jgi:signal-transduction protein with cAMP-binding, CBS, and nucleotidyltransferase domain
MNELPEIVRFLSALPGFDALGLSQIQKVASSIRVAYCRTGDEILPIESSNQRLHIVRSGAIELHNEEGGHRHAPAKNPFRQGSARNNAKNCR